jgi:tRNA(Leu) C34 or U34 (ribose-2'-O)-methylase TrmL
MDLCPYSAMPVAVDLVDGAKSLISFQHPNAAFYIFGPEDGTIPCSILEQCPIRIAIPTRHCINLAACVNVVLYDRMAKLGVDDD